MKIVHLNNVVVGNEKKQLLAFTIFCYAMLIARMIYTGSFEYRFMGFNLFLAWIPYLLVVRIIKLNERKQQFQIGFLLLLWLAFFPNAPYMLTDIYHLNEFPSVPKWYDLIMLLSFAWTGMMLAFFSFRKLHRKFLSNRKMLVNLGIVFSTFFICGTGVYLGRYERWNSWEILTQPATLINEFLALIGNQYALVQMLALSFVFGVFFTMIYTFIYSNHFRFQISDKA
jgi:uncharacterized membrane protein